jgi:hypothetical protein
VIFEIFNRQKQRVLYCYQTSCIPPNETLSDMQKGGYKFKIDGKKATLSQIKELRGKN